MSTGHGSAARANKDLYKMLHAPQVSPGLQLDPIPLPSIQVKRLMLATAYLVDGMVETMPEKWHPALEHSLVMPIAGVIVAGTRCARPILLREVRDIVKAVERDAIIVRATDRTAHATFDIVLNGVERPLCAYRLWMAQPNGCAWLVPGAGEATFVRLDPLGLELTSMPPFSTEVERYRGCKFGSDFLSVAVKGWF
jgi:hypothetical protein